MEKKKRKALRNTAKETSEDPMFFLADAMSMGADKAIENQEAQGQKSFVHSETLPVKMGSEQTIKILESAGVKFLGVVEGDPLFRYVELPKGWKKAPTSHSMWSDLLDEKGRSRASIFYKAAFYDRDAHLSLNRRYSAAFDYNRFTKEKVGVANVMDCGKVIHTTEPIPANNKERWDVSDEALKLATEWLNKNYPEWKNPGAYWD